MNDLDIMKSIAYQSYCWGYEDSHKGNNMMTFKQFKRAVKKLEK